MTLVYLVYRLDHRNEELGKMAQEKKTLEEKVSR